MNAKLQTLPRILFYAAAIGFALRMLLAAQPKYNFDVESYIYVVDIVRHGGNVFAETIRYNYSPVWSWILGLLSFLPLGLPVTVRAFTSIVDICNGILLGKTLGQKAAILYFLSPVAII